MGCLNRPFNQGLVILCWEGEKLLQLVLFLQLLPHSAFSPPHYFNAQGHCHMKHTTQLHYLVAVLFWFQKSTNTVVLVGKLVLSLSVVEQKTGKGFVCCTIKGRWMVGVWNGVMDLHNLTDKSSRAYWTILLTRARENVIIAHQDRVFTHTLCSTLLCYQVEV